MSTGDTIRSTGFALDFYVLREDAGIQQAPEKDLLARQNGGDAIMQTSPSQRKPCTGQVLKDTAHGVPQHQESNLGLQTPQLFSIIHRYLRLKR